VIVPAGHHTVEWTYHAPGLAVGNGVSIGTVVVLVGLLVWPRSSRVAVAPSSLGKNA